MKARPGPTAAIFAALIAAGCANDGTLSGLNTSSIDQPGANTQMAKSDPACLTLTAQIEALNRDGTADKVSKAAAKKYKLKTEDLAKADELNKANTEFQTKCSPYPPRPVVATTTTPATTTTTTTATTTTPKKVAAKKTTPPVPTAKPPATTAATTTPSTATPSTSTATPPQTAENPDPTLPQP